MLKRLLLNLIIIVSLLLPINVLANENQSPDRNEPTEIADDDTPESPIKKKNYSLLYLSAFIALGAVAYTVKQNSHRAELELSVDSIESNGDGSYIVSFGYDNPDSTISFNEGECGIRVLKGKAILLKKLDSNEFMKGQHKNSIIAVINSDSEIEYYAGKKKIYINGKDIIAKEEKEA